MQSTTWYSLRNSLVAAAAAGLFAACADNAPIGPKAQSATRTSTDLTASDGRFPDLAGCTQLQVPEGSRITFHAFGVGVQVYRWDGTKWAFSNPRANLYADASQNGLVGTHFSEPFKNPNWLTNSGSRVVGTVAARCTPNTNAIQTLKLTADNSGTGVFNQTNFIQRLNTVGGLAPTTPGTFVGQEFESPYSADYFFYHSPVVE